VGGIRISSGRKLILSGQKGEEHVRVEITVLHDTEVVAEVKTHVLEEREWIDGELVEVSRNFFARCQQTNDIFYFGEDVDNYEEGKMVNHDGTWRAGVHDALPGLIMPGTFLLGARYFQEIAPDVALDRAEHVARDAATPEIFWRVQIEGLYGDVQSPYRAISRHIPRSDAGSPRTKGLPASVYLVKYMV
jgi:hypothetical protein